MWFTLMRQSTFVTHGELDLSSDAVLISLSQADAILVIISRSTREPKVRELLFEIC